MKTSYKLLLSAALAWAAPAWAQAPAARDTVIELHDAHVAPRAQNPAELLQAMNETYPSAQRQAGTGATVDVSFVVGSDGVPRDMQVVSTTDSAFVHPTLAALSRLRFTPGQVDGAPVSVRVEVPVQWQVQAEEAAEQPGSGSGSAGPDSTRVYEPGMVETPPRLTNRADMIRAIQQYYPPALRRAGTTGSVTVRMRVGVDGRPADIHILQSTDPRFDDATIRVVNRLRFEPARLDGVPVPVWVETPIQWRRM